jgi:hypothetical protein
MMQKIELILDEEKAVFFEMLKANKNALIVPLDKWESIIHVNLGKNRVNCARRFRVICKEYSWASFGSYRGNCYERIWSVPFCWED